MCLIIAAVLLILGFNFFMAGNILMSVGSIAGSIFFIVLMVRNILHVKSLKAKEKNR
jgi:NADH:ubiquinone oxidoreductase subunit 6 (subunit J)